jgi:hypothetical protein
VNAHAAESVEAPAKALFTGLQGQSRRVLADGVGNLLFASEKFCFSVMMRPPISQNPILRLLPLACEIYTFMNIDKFHEIGNV